MGPFKCYVTLFSWEFDPHPPPRNAKNIELYTLVTFFPPGKLTPHPPLRYVTQMAPNNMRLADVGSRTEVNIDLRCRARDLIGFGPQFSGNTVSLSFDSRTDVTTALALTLRPAQAQQKGTRKVSIH